MTKEEITRMAREASATGCGDELTGDAIERFAALVAAAERNSWPAEMEAMERQVNILTDALAQAKAEEREACAKVCEEKQEHLMPIPCPDGISGCLVAHYVPARREKTGNECAAAIRARGETK